MPVSPIVSEGNGVPFLVSAGIVYEIIAAACSSPQTTELNANTRAPTLMKWVQIGLAQSVLFVGIAMAVDPQRAKPILMGGALAGTLMYGSYLYARKAGIDTPGAPTETHNVGGGWFTNRPRPG